MIDENYIREIVRQVVQRSLGASPDASSLSPSNASRSDAESQPATEISGSLVTERHILGLPRGAEVHIPREAILTPLAREHIMARQIQVLVGDGASAAVLGEGHHLSPDIEEPTARPCSSVAIGADHGGYDLKQQLVGYLQKMGYTVQDCGTHSTESVDYPDYAFAVAKLVADGRSERGVIIDGVGIGSCMAANKVPGIRAAMCYDLSTARNSREHNDANVLTLGGRMIGVQLAQQIVETWLSVSFLGGRHQRRVDKILDIERRFLRTR